MNKNDIYALGRRVEAEEKRLADLLGEALARHGSNSQAALVLTDAIISHTYPCDPQIRAISPNRVVRLAIVKALEIMTHEQPKTD